MTTRAVLPDGTVLQFEEGTDPDVIDYVVKQQLGVVTPEQPKTDSVTQAVALGALEPIDILASRLETVPALQPLVNLGKSLGLPSAQETLQKRDVLRQANTSELGQIAGNVAGIGATLPFRAVTAPASILQAAVGGGLAGGLMSRAEDVPQFASDVAAGGAFGAATQPVASLLSNAIAPKASSALKTLVSENVYPTIGMIAREADTLGGKIFSKAEDAATSIPVIGDLIQRSKESTIDEFGQAALNRAARAIGEKVPKELNGEEAVGWLKQKLSDGYNKLVPSLNFTVNTNFVQDVGDILKGLNIPSSRTELVNDWNAVFRDNVINMMDANGQINGANLQAVISNLGDLGGTLMKSADAFERRLGVGVSKLRGSFIDNLAKQNPAQAKALKNLNTGWAQEVRLQKATAGAAGRLTPQSLDRAVASFAKGQRTGPMSDLARAGRMIPSQLANSGTADRLLVNSIITGGLAGVGNEVAQALGYDGVSEGQALAIALIAAPYTPAGRRAIAKIMGREPSAAAKAVGAGARRVISPAAAAGFIAAPGTQR